MSDHAASSVRSRLPGSAGSSGSSGEFGRVRASLASADQALADSFGGRGSLKGADRFAAGRWRTLASGAPILDGAVGAIDCVLAETFRFHNTTIAVGRVAAFDLSERADALVFFGGGYRRLHAPRAARV